MLNSVMTALQRAVAPSMSSTRRVAAAALTAAAARAAGCGVPSLAGAAPARFSSDGIIPDKIVQHPYITGGKKYLPGFSFPAPRKLEQIVKYALLERESPARIMEIWNEYHDSRLDSVATTWSQAEFEGIAERKRRCPRFVYPVMKGDGKYFSLVAEWQDKYCIFTFLDDYKRNPSGAEPYFSVALYDELLPRKQLVLVRGDFTGHLTKRDAAHLLNLLRYFYFTDPRHVETFNRDPAAFDWTAFLRDCPPPPAKYTPQAGKVDRDPSMA